MSDGRAEERRSSADIISEGLGTMRFASHSVFTAGTTTALDVNERSIIADAVQGIRDHLDALDRLAVALGG